MEQIGAAYSEEAQGTFGELERRIGAGFLRNAVRRTNVTCVVCATPLELERGFSTCYPCKEMARAAEQCGVRIADQVIPLVYAIKGGQSAHLMHTYKTPAATPAGLEQLRLLLWTAFKLHRTCIEEARGQRLDAWATVPSTRESGRPHVLRNIVASVMDEELHEVPLSAGAGFVAKPRRFVKELWSAEEGQHVDGRHVLLVDDTWTTGAHAQSAASALYTAGASAVTILILARWLDPGWSPTQMFMKKLLAGDYDITHCPVPGDWSCLT